MVTALLNEQVPVSYRVQASSLWFDDECRTAKRALWLSDREREFLVASIFSRTPTVLLPLRTASKFQRRKYLKVSSLRLNFRGHDRVLIIIYYYQCHL